MHGRELLRVSLPLPPVQNHAYMVSRGRLVLTPAARAYITTVLVEVLRQCDGPPPLPPTFALELTWRLRHDRDIDGVKLVQDAFCKALGADDSRILRLVVEKHRDARNPRCEIVVRTVDDAA